MSSQGVHDTPIEDTDNVVRTVTPPPSYDSLFPSIRPVSHHPHSPPDPYPRTETQSSTCPGFRSHLHHYFRRRADRTQRQRQRRRSERSESDHDSDDESNTSSDTSHASDNDTDIATDSDRETESSSYSTDSASDSHTDLASGSQSPSSEYDSDWSSNGSSSDSESDSRPSGYQVKRARRRGYIHYSDRRWSRHTPRASPWAQLFDRLTRRMSNRSIGVQHRRNEIVIERINEQRKNLRSGREGHRRHRLTERDIRSRRRGRDPEGIWNRLVERL